MAEKSEVFLEAWGRIFDLLGLFTDTSNDLDEFVSEIIIALNSYASKTYRRAVNLSKVETLISNPMKPEIRELLRANNITGV